VITIKVSQNTAWDPYGTSADGAGNVWVTGSTSSLKIPLVKPYQGTYAGGPFDAYISKIALAVPQSIGVLEAEVTNLVVEGILNPVASG
jgi:hypothetical protein